jgi:hypothetical protein
MVGIGKLISAFAEPTHALDRTAPQQRSFRQDHHEQFQSEMERALQVLH